MDMHHFLSTHEMTYKHFNNWGAWMSSEEETNVMHQRLPCQFGPYHFY